jgi:ABC-type cobalamin transport system permease subunit
MGDCKLKYKNGSKILVFIKGGRNIKSNWFPESLIGKWSAGPSIAFIILILLKETKFTDLSVSSVAVVGLLGFITGIIAIFRKKERAISVLISIPIGLLIIFWIIGKMIYPH